MTESPEPSVASAQPEYRIPDAVAARQVISGLRHRHEQSKEEWELYYDQYNCEPPRDQCELEADDEGWRANANWGEFRAQISQVVDTKTLKVMSSLQPARFETDFGEQHQRERWMAAVSTEYKQMLHSWDGYLVESAEYLRDQTLFGHGPVYWENEGSWQFRSRPISSLYVPVNSGTNPDKWDMFFFRDEIRVHRLIDLLTAKGEDDVPKKARHKLEFWSSKAIRQCIENFAREGKDDGQSEGYQQNSASVQDIYADSFAGTTQNGRDKIEVFVGFVREYNGKWTQIVFESSEGGKGGNKDFLYQEKDARDRASDIIQINGYEPGRYYHEVKGLGAQISQTAQARDHFINSTIDSVMISSSPVFQADDEENDDLVDQVEFNWSHTKLPPKLNLIKSDLTHYTGLVELMRLVGQLSDRNTMHSSAQGFDRPATRTATEFRGQQAEKAELSQVQIMYFQIQQRRMHRTMMRQMVKTLTKHGKAIVGLGEKAIEAIDRINPGFAGLQKFAKACVEEHDVPFEALTGIDPDHVLVSIPPSIQGLQAISNLIPSLGKPAQDLYSQMLITLNAGDQMATKLIPDRPSILDQSEQWRAAIEHGNFRDGVFVPATAADDHFVHLDVHLKDAEFLMQPYVQNQGDFAEGGPLAPKEELLKTMAAHWEHSVNPENGHLSYIEGGMSGGNEQLVQGFVARWSEIYNYIEKLENEVNTQREAEANQRMQAAQGPDPVQMSKLQTEELKRQGITAQVQSDIQISQAKAQMEMQARQVAIQTKVEDHQIGQRMKEANMRFAQEQKAQAAEIENAIKVRSAQLDMNLRQATTPTQAPTQ